MEKTSFSSRQMLTLMFGHSRWQTTVLVMDFILRLFLTFLFFFLLAVAERTFKQRWVQWTARLERTLNNHQSFCLYFRFLYAKFFSHLTSSRRTRKSELPHFRLNKVRNIKTWLSVRSYLKVCIIDCKFLRFQFINVCVLFCHVLAETRTAAVGWRHRVGRLHTYIASVGLPKRRVAEGKYYISIEYSDSLSNSLQLYIQDSVQLQSQHTLQALIWSCALGCFILRFMTLGTKINRKYRSVSVLITEQINLYLQIEQKPHNKEELMVSNSVLKLAADLLKVSILSQFIPSIDRTLYIIHFCLIFVFHQGIGIPIQDLRPEC